MSSYNLWTSWAYRSFTHHFLRRRFRSGEEPGELKLDESKDVSAVIDWSKVLVVGVQKPVVASWVAREVNLDTNGLLMAKSSLLCQLVQ